MKYWLNGAPVIIPESNTDAVGVKYWLNGAPVVTVGIASVVTVTFVPRVMWWT